MSTETGSTTSDTDLDEDSGDGFSPYVRGVTVTTTATLLGILAGLLSMMQAAGPEDMTALLYLFAAILIQFPFYNLIGIDTDEFGTKDFLYITFMTFTLWFISWGILLTAGM